MTNGISLFLTHQIYSSDRHPLGCDKFAYDDENVHYVLLKVLCERSRVFAERFLSAPDPRDIDVTLKPERGLFDLLFSSHGERYYCEVKVWAVLSESQFIRQTEFLRERQAKGIYVLFTKAADAWSHQRVIVDSFGHSRVVGASDLWGCLESLEQQLPLDVQELALAYRDVIRSLNTRWPGSGV